MDLRSMAAANALLGNPMNASVLEILQQGARLRVLEDTWFSLAGGDFSSQIASGTAVLMRKGTRLHFDQVASGLYAYLAVPGGFESMKWLGSASTDLRNGMGMQIHNAHCLEPRLSQPITSVESVARRILTQAQNLPLAAEQHFTLHPGAQFEAFAFNIRQKFIQSSWTVSKRSDRVSYRLEGAELQVPKSIPSEPVLPGSFQITNGGQPIVTMADGPRWGATQRSRSLKPMMWIVSLNAHRARSSLSHGSINPQL
jgi:allophanate hydrolase subunit 2